MTRGNDAYQNAKREVLAITRRAQSEINGSNTVISNGQAAYTAGEQVRVQAAAQAAIPNDSFSSAEQLNTMKQLLTIQIQIAQQNILAHQQRIDIHVETRVAIADMNAVISGQPALTAAQKSEMTAQLMATDPTVLQAQQSIAAAQANLTSLRLQLSALEEQISTKIVNINIRLAA